MSIGTFTPGFPKIYIVFLLIASCILFSQCKTAPPKQFIIIVNASSSDRKNEVITIARQAFGFRENQSVPQIKKANKILISQTIDTNTDGKWVDLLIEVNLRPMSRDTLEIDWVKKESIDFKKITNVLLSVRSDSDTASAEITRAFHYRGFTQNIARPFYQMEGPGMENDKVAFRAFFDNRNGKDIYGKIVDTPVLHRVGVGASWHSLQWWGMDILKVGNSLGAGALAVIEDKKIYRLGDADKTTFNAMYEGPLQAAFNLDFQNWDVGMAKQHGSETIIVTKGDYYYKNDIAIALNSRQQLLAGMANFGPEVVTYKKHNAIYSSVSTYGKQAEGSDTNLGLAILFLAGDYIENKTADSASTIPNTTYVALKPHHKQSIYFFACWEKSSGRFHTRQGFDDYLHETAFALANPIQVKIIKKIYD